MPYWLNEGASCRGGRVTRLSARLEKVCHAVEYVVQWGSTTGNLIRSKRSASTKLPYGRGDHYWPLVYQIEPEMNLALDHIRANEGLPSKSQNYRYLSCVNSFSAQ